MARQREKLYSKYGVYGSSAYDFRTLGNEGPGDYCKKGQALSKKPRRYKDRPSPALAVGCLLCAVLMMAALMSQSSLIALSQETVTAREEIEELLNEQRTIKIRHEMAFSLAETEEYAIEVLGMKKPTADQISYIDIDPIENEE